MRCTLIFQLGSQLGIQCWCYPSKDGAFFADPQMKLGESWVSFQEAQWWNRKKLQFFQMQALSGFYHIQKSFLETLHMILVMLKKLSNGWGKWWKLNLVEPLEVVHQNALDILVVTWKKKMFCNDPWSLKSRHCVYMFWNGKRWLNKKSDRKLQFLCG